MNTIQSIELVNFMCHDHLQISFEKMITCIGGRNGSGKSAVMVALGILFGQRAQALERGNSFKCLIKTGANQAIIRVVINNTCRYKIDRYGERITIEKKLRDISTRVSIFNSSGKIFKTNKNELENIIEKFGLKFDNPLNFLTQERSKKFLNASSAEELYDFYYQGTEFKNIEEDLEEGRVILEKISDKIDEIRTNQERIESSLGVNNRALKFLEFDPELALRNLELHEKWNQINEKKKAAQEMEKTIKTYSEDLIRLNEERIAADMQMTVRYTEESTDLQEEELSKLKVHHHSVKSELEEYVNKRIQRMSEIQRIKSKNNTAQLAESLEDLEDSLSDKKKRLSELEEQREGAHRAYQDEKAANAEKEKTIYALRRQLEYLKQNANDQNKQRHIEDVARINKELKNASFRDIVLGPVSKYLKLKEHKWYKVASIVLGRTLNNYIVFNSEDKLKLLSIFNRLGTNYSVTQMFRKTPYKNLKYNPKFKTLMDILEIGDPLVLNQLITLNSIEQIILIEDRENAHRVIKSDPSNVESAYTITGDRIKLVNGSLSDYRSRDDGAYWFEDKESKIRKIEDELRRVTITDECRARYNKITNEIGVLSVDIENMEKKAASLKIELESLSNIETNDMEGIEKKIQILNMNISSLENKRLQLETQMNEIEEAKRRILESNQRKKDEYQAKMAATRKILSSVDYDMMVIENKRSIAMREMDMHQSFVKSQVPHILKEPEILKTPLEIEKERKMVCEFKVKSKNLPTKEEIESQIAKMTKELSDMTRLRSRFEGSLKDVKEAYNKRVQKRDELKKKNTEDAVRLFKEYTMRSGYVGEMYIDHGQKRIDLKMRVHDSNISGSKRTLSGGERSFAGVCFLLSMWKCIQCPVKILDEFDVFMDPLNRRMAIKSLFEFFKDNQVQVILITPLDTSDLVDPDCDIKVLKKIEIS